MPSIFTFRPALLRWLCAVVCLALSLHAGLAAEPAGPARASTLLASPRPLVIAHRGYSAAAPENTLPAFRLAVAAGADLVELDYYHTRDGVPIVIHDADLDRTTDAGRVLGGRKIRVDSRSASELARLDAGSWFRTPTPGVRLPLLTEALDLIQSNSVTLIERKAGDAASCVKLLRERQLINEVIVQAFDWAYLRDFHALEPRQILGALGPPSTREGRKLTEKEKALSPEWIEEVHRTGAQLVVWNRQIDRAAVSAARARGLKVWAYTINDPALANQLLDAGVEGLITDNPSVIWRTLALRARAEAR